MIAVQRYEVIRDGDVLPLALPHYTVTGFSGYGSPKPSRRTIQGPAQHGVTDLGFTLDPRSLILTLVAYARSGEELIERESELYAFFGARDKPSCLRITRGDGSVRQIEIQYSEGLEGDETGETFFSAIKRAIALTCPDPIWYDPNTVTLAFDLGISTTGWAVPMPVPLAVGADSLSQAQSVSYRGTWLSHPIITIRGPVTGLVIESTVTGERLAFRSDVAIGEGETWKIDCTTDDKRVVDGAGVTHTGSLEPDSDLATFHLAPRSEVPDGTNSFWVTGSGASPNTAIHISFNERYYAL